MQNNHDAPPRETESINKLFGIITNHQNGSSPSKGQHDAIFHNDNECPSAKLPTGCMVCAHNEIADQCKIENCAFCADSLLEGGDRKLSSIDWAYPTVAEIKASKE